MKILFKPIAFIWGEPDYSVVYECTGHFPENPKHGQFHKDANGCVGMYLESHDWVFLQEWRRRTPKAQRRLLRRKAKVLAASR